MILQGLPCCDWFWQLGSDAEVSHASEQPSGVLSETSTGVTRPLTILSLFPGSRRLENAKTLTTQAAREKYVFTMALCWLTPGSAMAELKLGQNIHRKSVPAVNHTKGSQFCIWKSIQGTDKVSLL